jgi:hypothetical protein
MPANRHEVKDFHEHLATEKILWQPAYQKENSRKRGDFTIYRVYESQSREGYRIVWVHSSSKQQNDASIRERQIKMASKNLQTLSEKLNRYQLKTRKSIQSAASLAVTDASDYLSYKITKHSVTESKQIGCGKPNSKTKYTKKTITTYKLSWSRNETAIKASSITDGIFPLVDNTDKNAVEVLKIYKQQPYLEKRHSTLKTVEKVSPIYFKKPERIEAMLFLYFVALMIISLIERNLCRNLSSELLTGQQVPPGQETQLSNTLELSKPQEQRRIDPRFAPSISELVKETLIESPNTVLPETFEIIDSNTEEPLNYSKPVVSVPLAVPLELKITTQEVYCEETSSSNPFVSAPLAVPLEPKITTREVHGDDAPISSNPFVSVPLAVPLEPKITTREVHGDDAPISSKPVVSVPLAVPLEPKITTREVHGDDAPIGSKPVISVPLAIQPEPEITTPTVSIEETSTHSPPKVTSAPLFKPQQLKLPDVSMGLPILPQGMKTKMPTWENIKYVLKQCLSSGYYRRGSGFENRTQGNATFTL